MKVGTKELKNRLSHYLGRVRGGECVLVTDRGVVVAEIRRVPSARGADERALQDLEADGLATRGTGKLEEFDPVALPRGARVSRLIVEDRG